ncbi:MAG: geranylgeranylglyceryl/heptaprenylglyceryl phosphate synthase [Thermoplasmatales archaeon]|jgi:phosphoglycerol geranylgeranyltransferase|nr:geranylgeranylglyceryl/heptaprenylglyceryl phosphate synthase [Thermoplasmatales archaeon]
MNVKKYLMDGISKGTLHMSLLDPDKQTPDEAARIALECKKAGTDAVMIGGSTGVTQENLDATAIAIKKATGLPVIFFPGGPQALSPHCDAIYFMSMINSTDLNYVMNAQIHTSLAIRKLGIEPISMGYIVVEPGMRVGEVGKADLIKRDDRKKAMSCALAAEYLGMSFVYLEAGSGADLPVPPEMVRAVKEILKVPLIVGGGIRTPEAARAAREAGADAVVTGTFLERCNDSGLLNSVVKASKGI